MEYLRWILLAAGIFFILFIYLLGRNRRRKNAIDEIESQEDVPGFSAQDWDDLDEGVGKVRIIARDTSEDIPEEDADYGAEPVEEEVAQVIEETAGQAEYIAGSEGGDQQQQPERRRQDPGPSDIIVLHIIARPDQQFSGDKINSAAKANGLVFGDMNIFHRLDDFEQAVFSLANMVEPGSFDPAIMHDLKTPGLTMFMQVSEVVEPETVFNDMLSCAYRMSEMLDGQLCNRRRQVLTQNDAEKYRELVTGVDA